MQNVVFFQKNHTICLPYQCFALTLRTFLQHLLGVGDVQVLPQHLVYRLLVGRRVLVQIEQFGEVDEAVVGVLLYDAELLGHVGEPPPKEGGVQDGIQLSAEKKIRQYLFFQILQALLQQ